MITSRFLRAGTRGMLLATLLLCGCGGDDRVSGEAALEPPDTPPSATPPAQADAGTADGSPQHDTAAPQEGELLLATPPQGWQETGAMQTPALRMAEYGPAQESDGRVERLTFEAQSGDPLPDPIEFVKGIGRDLAVRCEGLEDINISSGHENGYPASVRLMVCPKFKDSPHGQVVMAKAIQGNEELYVITRRLRVAPMEGDEQPLTAQDMAAWTTHLKAVQVCDTRTSEHPCPDSVARPVRAGN